MDDLEMYWFHYDMGARQALAEEYKNIPLTVLDLNIRTRNALRRHDRAIDVAALLCANVGIQQVRGIGAKALKEINDHFIPLVEGAEIALAISETATIETILPISNYKPLPDAVAELSIGVLHLPKRVFGTLERVGIETIGEIEWASPMELEKIPNLGHGGLSAIYERIGAIRNAVDEENGHVDWYGFWASQGIDLIPAGWTSNDSVQNILTKLPSIVEAVCLAEVDERAWLILKRRFGFDGKPTLILEDLGTAFSLTRERVRQIERDLVQHFRRIFLDNGYIGKGYHVQPDAIKAFREIDRVIEAKVSEGIPETDLRKSLDATFDIGMATLDRVLEFIFAICGVQKLNFNLTNLESVYFSATTSLPSGVELIIPIVHNFLTHQATPASDVDILIEVNQQLRKKDRIQLADLRSIVPLCKTIETVEGGGYQGKFEYLSTRVDQIERVLSDAAKPLTVATICREMNHRIMKSDGKTVTERSLVNQVISDERFSPIGRSGSWTLTEWAIETGDIVDLMKQFLMTKNGPATVDEITAYVQDKRPASDASIKWYLGFDATFAQITRSTWGLSTWEEARIAKLWNPTDVAQFIEDFFRTQKVRRIDFKIIKQALMDETGYSDGRVQRLLGLNPAITTELIGEKERVAIFQPDYQDKIKEGRLRSNRKKKTLFEKIEEDVRLALESAPGTQMGLATLIDLLTEKYGKRYTQPYQSLHGYISRMDFVEKVPIEGSKLLMCRLMNAHSDGMKSRADKIRTTALRANVRRSLDFLTEENVDIALFLMSKEFEATLHRYMELAITMGEIPPLGPKDRLSLAKMVSMIKTENVLTDDAVLSFLRQSRNDRAHGAMPSVEERRMMMAQIGVTAGMYIDYIQFFDELALELEAAS